MIADDFKAIADALGSIRREVPQNAAVQGKEKPLYEEPKIQPIDAAIGATRVKPNAITCTGCSGTGNRLGFRCPYCEGRGVFDAGVASNAGTASN